MSDSQEPTMYPLAEALRALEALREVGGLGPEMFPVQAFVGMISDEIEALRQQGQTDQDIADTIAKHSAIRITPQQIAENYATPEQRHGEHG